MKISQLGLLVVTCLVLAPGVFAQETAKQKHDTAVAREKAYKATLAKNEAIAKMKHDVGVKRESAYKDTVRRHNIAVAREKAYKATLAKDEAIAKKKHDIAVEHKKEMDAKKHK